MKEETVSLIPKDEKPKGTIPRAADTPSAIPKEAKEHIEKVRQEAAYRTGQVPQGVPVIAADNASAVVMDPKNPHLSLYRELRAGIITLEEFQEALDCQMCKPEILQGFRYILKPEKPKELMDAEHEITMQTVRMNEVKKNEVMRDFNTSARDRFKKYYKELDHNDELNRSNLYTLKDLLSRQQNKNQVFAARIQAVIDTH